MKIIKTKGIIISEHNTQDFDKMLTVLTPNLRKNYMYRQRRKKAKEPTYGRDSAFVLFRIYFI